MSLTPPSRLRRATSTHKGMATYTQLKLWFAAHLLDFEGAGAPQEAEVPSSDGLDF